MKTKTTKTTKHPHPDEIAMEQAKVNAVHQSERTHRAALLAHLQQAWRARHQLGNSGVLVLPKSWYTGPEQLRRAGLSMFCADFDVGNAAGFRIIQEGPTELASAILDGKDQSENFRNFIRSTARELAQLGTLGY